MNKKIKEEFEVLHKKTNTLYNRIYDVERDLRTIENNRIEIDIKGEKKLTKSLKLSEAVALIGNYLKLKFEEGKLIK